MDAATAAESIKGKNKEMVYLICGPPGCGKSTYVKNHIVDGDIVIDFDLLYRALTLADDHKGEQILFERVNQCRWYLIDTISAFPEVRNTWIIIGAPEDEHIDYVEKTLGGKVLYLDEFKRTCVRRCVARGGDYELWRQILDEWFAKHDGKYDQYAAIT